MKKEKVKFGLMIRLCLWMHNFSRTVLDNFVINSGRMKLMILLNGRHIEHKYVIPSGEEYAWDDTYANGNIFREGYPHSLRTPYEGEKEEHKCPSCEEVFYTDPSTDLLPSDTYAKYMRWNAVSEWIHSQRQAKSGGWLWLLMIMAIIGIGAVMFLVTTGVIVL